MYQTIDLINFRDAFKRCNRLENFTYEGLELLFDWLKEYEEDTGDNIELDVISICCDFCQDEWEEIKRSYSIDAETKEEVLDYLNDNTLVVGVDGETIIFASSF